MRHPGVRDKFVGWVEVFLGYSAWIFPLDHEFWALPDLLAAPEPRHKAQQSSGEEHEGARLRDRTDWRDLKVRAVVRP